MIIYKIQNLLNGKIYIGQTKRNLKIRMLEHIRHKTTLSDDIKKFGLENFDVQKIDFCFNQLELDEKERYWINFYNSIEPNGYNKCYGGLLDSTGYKHTDISKKKMSISKSIMYLGKNNPFYGKKHNDETKSNWSQKRKELKHLTDEQKKNLKESHFKKKVICIETNEIFNSIKEASEKYNIKATHITRVCKGKRKTTGGFHWKYIDNTR